MDSYYYYYHPDSCRKCILGLAGSARLGHRLTDDARALPAGVVA